MVASWAVYTIIGERPAAGSIREARPLAYAGGGTCRLDGGGDGGRRIGGGCGGHELVSAAEHRPLGGRAGAALMRVGDVLHGERSRRERADLLGWILVFAAADGGSSTLWSEQPLVPNSGLVPVGVVLHRGRRLRSGKHLQRRELVLVAADRWFLPGGEVDLVPLDIVVHGGGR